MLRNEIIDQLEQIDNEEFKDELYVSINVFNDGKKVKSNPYDILNSDVWKAWKSDFDFEKLMKYPSLNINLNEKGI